MVGVVLILKLLSYILLLLLGSWCWYQWKFRRQIAAASKLYSGRVKPLPFLGHSVFLSFNWRKISDWIIDEVEYAVANGIKNMVFVIGWKPHFLVMNSEDVQKVLLSSSTSEKADEMKVFAFALGNGLLTAPNNIWKITRRHISPLFHPRKLEQLLPMFNRNTREMVSVLSEHVDGPAFNALDYTMKTGLKSSCHFLYGSHVEVDDKDEKFLVVYKALFRLSYMIMQKITRPELRIAAVYNFFYGKEEKNTILGIREFTETMIKASRNKHLTESKEKFAAGNLNFERNLETLSQEGVSNLLDVYTRLQQLDPAFTDEDLNFEINTFYAAATETLGGVTATGLLALAQHRHIQERLYEEINSVLDNDDDVKIDHLNKMPYLDQVYKETLRWADLVPIILRKTTEDLKLSDCTIPTNSTVAVALFGVHVNPNNYPDPRNFDPDRFSQEKTEGMDRGIFVPYSRGPRDCIGKYYAQLMFKVMIVNVLRRYKLSTKQDMRTMKHKLFINKMSLEGYNIRLQYRDRE